MDRYGIGGPTDPDDPEIAVYNFTKSDIERLQTEDETEEMMIQCRQLTLLWRLRLLEADAQKSQRLEQFQADAQKSQRLEQSQQRNCLMFATAAATSVFAFSSPKVGGFLFGSLFFAHALSRRIIDRRHKMKSLEPTSSFGVPTLKSDKSLFEKLKSIAQMGRKEIKERFPPFIYDGHFLYNNRIGEGIVIIEDTFAQSRAAEAWGLSMLLTSSIIMREQYNVCDDVVDLIGKFRGREKHYFVELEERTRRSTSS